MLVTAKTRRDPFTFSLGGMAGIKASTFVPVVPDDMINRSLDLRFRQQAAGKTTPPALIQRIEDTLARYFATGHCLDR
jgi:hypothetical protein